MNDSNKEYLFLAQGILYALDVYGIIISSSDKSISTISFLLNDNVYPPFASHKFIRNDIIRIRDYFNEYLERTEVKDE